MHYIAHRIIKKLGGPRAVADMLGMSVTGVYKWTYPKEVGGVNGLIPAKRQLELMIAAKQRGIILTAEDFFPQLPKKRAKRKGKIQDGTEAGQNG